MVIGSASYAVPVTFVNPGRGIREETLQAFSEMYFTRFKINVRTMLLTTGSKPRVRCSNKGRSVWH